MLVIKWQIFLIICILSVKIRSFADQWWRWECQCWCRCWCNWSWPLGRRRKWGRPGCGCRRCPVGCSAGTSACSRWCCGQTLSLSTQSLMGCTEGGESDTVNTLWGTIKKCHNLSQETETDIYLFCLFSLYTTKDIMTSSVLCSRREEKHVPTSIQV